MEHVVKNIVTEQDLINICQSKIIQWKDFRNKTFLITGATGTIGSFIVRTLIKADEKEKLNITIIAFARNQKKAKFLFKEELKHKKIKLIVQDIQEKIKYNKKVNYIIHCANNTDSKSFVNYPAETIKCCVDGTKNILDFAYEKNIESLVYLSSMEVYGLIGFEKEKVSEKDIGLIDILNPRSSYPQSKRTAETLCTAYYKEKQVPVKIARLAQTFGSNVDYNESRVFAQFARSIVEEKDIILHTDGAATRSYCYITDAVTGILLLLLKGNNGEAYNIANEESTKSIKDVASMLCEKYKNSSLKFEYAPANYPPDSNWKLDTAKIRAIGWFPCISLDEMFDKLINSFYEQKSNKLNKSFKNVDLCENLNNHLIINLFGLKLKFKINFLIKYYIKKVRKEFGINPYKIVFDNYCGKGFGCNPKYIALEFIKRKLPYELVWLLKEDEFYKIKDFPKNIRVVNYSSKEALFELATAKFWIENYHKNYFIKKGLTKSKDQIYIQTWHGSLGIKKIDRNVKSLTHDFKWLSAAKKNSKMTDIWISNSSWETDIYKKAFWNVNNVKELGHPRNDIFYYINHQDIKNKVFDELNIPKNKKIVLYAPSFRDNTDFEYKIDFEKVLKALKQKFDDDWVFVVRLHPRLKNFSKNLFDCSSSVVDGSSYWDIQELLAASDVLITDYSSCIFDFMLSKKPAFMYATDIKLYNQERGFYYPIDETPFLISGDDDLLVNNIMNFDYDKYIKEVDEFLKNKGCVDDGQASKRTVDLILNCK